MQETKTIPVKILHAFTFLLFWVVFGCGQSQPPIAGGHPTEYWINALNSEKAETRVEAVKKLGNIGSKARTALPSLRDSLSDDATVVRKEAIFAVVRNWPASRDALPELESIKENDTDPEVRKIAAEALQNLTRRK